ncbi:DUF4190 domain-containing protein [uncultured Corynebacterium sp.]|uniref:DUF4190 domain-containing protein n=1 Tax=uncultured Corynebacterium sp. TaxID=159447 RepID=UPI0025EACD80|nr:DUF4190 domain-containing protein [uncultured Corynebacterium sp.]
MTTPNNPYGPNGSADPSGGVGPNGAFDSNDSGAQGDAFGAANAGGRSDAYGSNGSAGAGASYGATGSSIPSYNGAEAYNGSGAYSDVPFPASYEAPNEGKNGWALAALIVGIVALLSMFVLVGPFIMGPVGFIVALVALVRGRKFAPAGRRTWMSVTGMVLSILSVILMLVFFFVAFGALDATGVMECAEEGADQAQMQQCMEDRMNDYLQEDA